MHKQFHIELIVQFEDVEELHQRQCNKQVLDLNLYSFEREIDAVTRDF
jgi:hypothetical protein